MNQNPNRLIKEKSPYLLQHAHNPVNWYPWGEEAFKKAKAEDKPVILSIGYSTCHWCHVMAHESFENDDIAKIMNENFISIKVDREERPDIDQIYMAAVTAMTGQGGWPLTVFLTPSQEPFFGGTYFPPMARWGAPGFVDLLSSISQTWSTNREGVLQSSANLTTFLKESHLPQKRGDHALSVETLDRAFMQLSNSFDAKNGGLGHAPKFPMGHNFSFLLRYWKRSGNKQALAMVEQSLKAMACGGMYDQIGGGFHRYSTDEYWHVPHFEKMLYDQALLGRVLTEAYQITKNEFYATIARETLDYILRDMRDPQGGFFSAEDADSQELENDHHKKEGAFYVWSQAQWNALLGEAASVAAFYFGVEKEGNARVEPHGEFGEKNILYVAHTIEETAQEFNRDVDDVQSVIHKAQDKLFHHRLQRPKPHLDDKVLVDWNGLMISSLAYAGAVFKEPRYQNAAKKAADFILQEMIDSSGRLLHRFREGEAGILGGLEDYAFFVQGLLDLYESNFQIKYMDAALKLSQEMIRLFEDSQNGGFFLTASDAESLIVRPKEIYDGAIPSGNSVAALNMARLMRMTGNDSWRHKVEGILKNFSAALFDRPSAYCYAMTALDFMIGPSREIVIASLDRSQEFESWLDIIYQNFMPGSVVLARIGSEDSSDVQRLIKLIPYLLEQSPIENKVTAYICENQVCKLPLTNVNEFKNILAEAC